MNNETPPIGIAPSNSNAERGDSEKPAVHSDKKSHNERVEFLEVEDEDMRAGRLQSLFKKLNSNSSSPSEPSVSAIPSYQFDSGERKTWAVEPPSELLSRVQSFLPRIEASNAILNQRVETDPQSVDMEQLENSERYIEMNLGLGVYDVNPQGPSSEDQDTEMTDSSFSSSSSSPSSSMSSLTSSNSDSGSDDSDPESELDSEEILSSCIPSSLLSRSSSSTSQSTNSIGSNGKMKAPRLIRPLPRRIASSASQPRPSIVVLNEVPNRSPTE
ncbi:hypothetical protein FB446DRAFT_728738 [Lentinula raphanica]|nr:hypothetical protein FB446DRAFT_728738 [Lentinula raphanica]